MASEYIIRQQFDAEWRAGRTVSRRLVDLTQRQFGIAFQPVHGDPILGMLADDDLLCYFIYTLCSWWEIPLVDRINAGRPDNGFAILMDINPAPETMFRLRNRGDRPPRERYTSGLREVFPTLQTGVADAMFSALRNGFGHNLFGREPGRILIDDRFDCPPVLNEENVLLVPPVQLALSMISSFLHLTALLSLRDSDESIRTFKSYMTGSN